MSNTPNSTEIDRAEQVAADLEKFAAFIRANPAAAGFRPPTFVRYLLDDDTVTERMASLIRAGLRAGARVEKSVTDNWMNAALIFGGIKFEVYTDRDAVCERVVTGRREVVEEIPDPEALAAATAAVPLVMVTRIEEDVTWKCRPLLAATEQAATVAS